jgi:hypothetical protein
VSRRASQRGERAFPLPPPRPLTAGVSPTAAAEQKRPHRLLAAGVALAVLIVAVVAFVAWPTATPVPPLSASPASPAGGPGTIAASYVGAETCKTCHESEFKAWTGSHHQLAMQEATPASVLGNFDNARFNKDGVESTFFKRGDKFMVRTDGPDGKLATTTISYTFGVYPLQQYLIPFPGGRYQMLPIAWDARPKEGGQRWFHLYPRAEDRPHATRCTGPASTRTGRCSAPSAIRPICARAYDAASQTYHTTYSEINVACEACHGPAFGACRAGPECAAPPYAAQDDKGLPSLKTRWNEAWKFPGEGCPHRRARSAGRPRRHEQLRRLPFPPLDAERGTQGRRAVLEDSHRLAMLTAPNYHADGQQREEVYVWGSFLQSRMHQNGVTCMDCHEPHSHQAAAPRAMRCARAATRRASSTARLITIIRPVARAPIASPATCRRRTTW